VTPTSLVERLLVDPKGYGIPATNCQRAWCRILDGVDLGVLWEDEDVRRMCGGVKPPLVRPSQFVGTKAPRTGGSIIGACLAITRAVHCDTSWLTSSENPPILPIVSVRIRNARAIVGHVKRLMSRPEWQRYLIGTPKEDSVTLRHARTGWPIKIEVVAGSTAASNLESYWCASVIFDECFKLRGAEEAAVNLDDARLAISGRILPGGQTLYVGSTWVPEGPAYKLMTEFWERPCQECVVVRTTGPQMNPRHWTAQAIQDMAASPDQRMRDAAVLAMGEFVANATGVLPESEIKARTIHAGRLLAKPGVSYAAVMDPGIRRNAWTFGICHTERRKLVLDCCCQWQAKGGVKLVAREILHQIAGRLKEYGLDRVYSDQHQSDTLDELAQLEGFRVVERRQRGDELQLSLQGIVDAILHGNIELQQDPELVKDLLNIKRRVSQSGTSLYLAATPDGRHADYAAMLSLAALVTPGDRPGVTAVQFPDGFLDADPPKLDLHPEEKFATMRPLTDDLIALAYR